MNKINSPKAATAYSQTQAEVYDKKRFHSRAGVITHQTELAPLLAALNNIPADGSVLEVGCGTGRLLLECARRGYPTTGADASPDMLAELETKLTDQGFKPELITAEAAELPLPDDNFNLVYAIRLLNQTESPAYALRTVTEMIRVAKPGGYILAECVNASRPKIGRNKSVTTRLSSDDIVNTARQANAEAVSIDGAFFLGMGTFYSLSSPLVPIVSAVDAAFSRLAPKACSRIYVLLKKGS